MIVGTLDHEPANGDTRNSTDGNQAASSHSPGTGVAGGASGKDDIADLVQAIGGPRPMKMRTTFAP